VRNAGTFHVATQTWTRVQGQSALGPDTLYNNNAATGYYGPIREGQFRVDEGRIPSTTSEGNADSYDVNGFQFGYCSTQTSTLDLNVAFLDLYTPCSEPGAFTTLGSIGITGAPAGDTAGQRCWLFTVDVEGTSLEFSIAGDGDGFFDGSPGLDMFGMSLSISGHGVGTETGFFIAGDPAAAPFGDGTVPAWGFGAGPDGTGLAQSDFYWIEDSVGAGGPAAGCYWYGGYPANPWGGYHEIVIGGNGGGNDGTEYCPANANSIDPGGATLAGTGGTFGTAGATFQLTNIPTQPGLLYAGPNQPNLPFGCGNRCVGGTVIRGAVQFPTANTHNTSFDMSPANAVNIQYWYRDPAHNMTCGAAYNLSNALMP